MNHLSNDPAKSYTVNNGEFSVALCVGWRLPLPDYILSPTLNCHQNTNQRAKCSRLEAEEGRLEINFQGDVALFHTKALLCLASTDIIWFSFVCYNRIYWYIASVYGDGFHKVICNMRVCVCVFTCVWSLLIWVHGLVSEPQSSSWVLLPSAGTMLAHCCVCLSCECWRWDSSPHACTASNLPAESAL